MKIPSSLDDLTSEWFTSNIHSYGSRVVDVTLRPMDIGAMCRMVRAELVWDVPSPTKPSSVIVKFPTNDAGTLNLAKAMGMYELETRFYRDLQPLLGDLSVPRCFCADLDLETGAFVLILEDLSSTTRPGDVLTESTPDECRSTLAELATLQSASWNSPTINALDWLADPLRTIQVFDSIPLGLDPFLERFGGALDPEHVRLFESVIPKAGQWIRSWTGPKVVQHGDLRTDNVLFGSCQSAPAATIIDFQTVRLGPPGVDPAYFLGSSLTVDTRRETERDLISEYHRILTVNGVGEFSADACFAEYRAGAMYAVFLFCGLSVQVASSPRIDEVIANQTRRYAEMAIDLESAQLAGLT